MKRLLTIIILMELLLPYAAFAAIAFDSHGNSGAEGGSSSFSFNNAAGNYLVAMAWTDGATDNVTGITYNSVSLTKGMRVLNVSGIGSIAMWYLAAPATGSNTLAYTFSSGTGMIKVETFSGVASGAPAGQGVGTGSGTSFSMSTTTVPDNAWISIGTENSAGSYTASTNVTLRESTEVAIGDTNAALTPPGSYTQTETVGGSQNWGGVQFVLAPGAAATVVPDPGIVTIFN